MKCEECGEKMSDDYRFTDWYEDSNDEYGTFKECKKIFDTAIKKDKEGRYSIYDISYCKKCDYCKDEGILYNENCSEYKVAILK